MRYKVIIEAASSDPPKKHEFTAAAIAAEYFKADVTFLSQSSVKTPDFSICGVNWELKSPLGGSARTIENNMRSARKQSKNIILDLSRIKMHQLQALTRLTYFLSKPHQFKRVLVITKTRKIIEIL